MEQKIKIYKTKVNKFSGTNFQEVCKKALGMYKQIKKKTKRRPYIRSVYFNKSKIFLELFWKHLQEKENFRDKTRRVKYFSCAIDLIQCSRFNPISKDNPNRSSEILHRFTGITKNNDLFFVQIKENKRNGEKWLMSVFPKEKTKKTFR